MKIYATNPIVTNNPNTALSVSCLAGATSLSIYSDTGFNNAPLLILLGIYADQQAEIVKASSFATLVATLSTATLFPHPQDTPFTFMSYDQVEFSRSDDAGVSWSVIGLINIQVDRNSTVFIDNTGQSTSQWRFRFYNSLTTVYSNYSSSVGQSGYERYQLEKIQDQVVSLFPDPNMTFLTFQDIADWSNDCSDILAKEIYGSDIGALLAYSSGTVTNPGGTITLPSNFSKLKRLAFSSDGTNFYKAHPLPLGWSYFDGLQSDAFSQFVNTDPVYYRDSDTIYAYPNGTNGTPSLTNYNLWYYRLPNYLSAPSDSLDLIFRPYSNLYVNYCLWRAKLKDKKPKEGASYKEAFNEGFDRFVEQMTTWQLDEVNVIDEMDFQYLSSSTRTIGKL